MRGNSNVGDLTPCYETANDYYEDLLRAVCNQVLEVESGNYELIRIGTHSHLEMCGVDWTCSWRAPGGTWAAAFREVALRLTSRSPGVVIEENLAPAWLGQSR